MIVSMDRYGLRWWNYFGVAAFQVGRAACDACAPHADDTDGRCVSQGHTAVTEKQMELQMFASLTAGATGLLYWMIG